MADKVVNKVHLNLEGYLHGGFLQQGFTEDIREGNWEISLHGIVFFYQKWPVDVVLGVYSNLTGDDASSQESLTRPGRTRPPALGFDVLPAAEEEEYHIMNIGGGSFPITDPAQYVQILFRDVKTMKLVDFDTSPYCSVIVNLSHINI